MCCVVPVPAEPNESLSGFAFRYATSSGMVLAGTEGCTTTTFFSSAAIVIGEKSFTASNGILSA